MANTFVSAKCTHQQEAAYEALSKVADRIGANNYKSQLQDHLKRGRSRKTFRFFVTDAHRNIVNAMDDVLNGKITSEEAFAMIHYDYEVNKERFAK